VREERGRHSITWMKQVSPIDIEFLLERRATPSAFLLGFDSWLAGRVRGRAYLVFFDPPKVCIYEASIPLSSARFFLDRLQMRLSSAIVIHLISLLEARSVVLFGGATW
jgi:hypothetical protein